MKQLVCARNWTLFKTLLPVTQSLRQTEKSDYFLRSSSSKPRLRCPWATHRPPTAPRALQHKWLATSSDLCSRRMCVFTTVCVHFGWVNAKHKFRVWVTILGCMSRHFHFVTFTSFSLFQCTVSNNRFNSLLTWSRNVKSSQVTFIYIAPLTIQIVTKHCTISK